EKMEEEEKGEEEDERGEEEDERETFSINIPQWPSLDSHVQLFAHERFYNRREEGVHMEIHELIEIMTKIECEDPSVKFPAKDTQAIERLQLDVSSKILTAVRKLRYGNLIENVQMKARVDEESLEEMQRLLQKNKKGDEPNEIMEEMRQRLFKEIRVSHGEEEDERESGIILLDDDEDKEGDEDELDVKEEMEGEEEEDGDIFILNHNQDSDDDDNNTIEINEDDEMEKDSDIVEVSDTVDGENDTVVDKLQDMEKALANENEESENEEEEYKFIDVLEVQKEGIVDEDEPRVIQTVTNRKKSINLTKKKVKEIQKWINGIANFEEDKGEESIETKTSESEDPSENCEEDDEIECVEDDFEMDSASHSGLKQRKKKEEEKRPAPSNEVIEID
ncbi:hypothetical protein PMAYCL1PPCAC_29850, partial [Pristionchus mayeri]